MENFIERPKPEIKPTIDYITEQKPFESEAVGSFFAKWCEINDSIVPQIVTREEWEQKSSDGILEKRPDGKQSLFIPKDLKLWEMIGIVEVVDHDTFAEKPDRRDEAKEKLLALGKTFKDAGIYIAKRLEGISDGNLIAKALASEFYEYGESIIDGKKPEDQIDISVIASQDLTQEETEAIDRFLAGDNIYESRHERAERALQGADQEKRDDVYEQERQKTLAQFFRVAQKAFELRQKDKDEKLRESKSKLKPWENDAPIHKEFLRKIESAIRREIETPKRELNMAIFRRGMEKLVSEMRETKESGGWRNGINKFFEKIGLDLRVEQRKLAEAIGISKLKAELEETRKTGDKELIGAKEREIADKIQKAVSAFPYERYANNPSEMVANQYINCVGASTLGGALMKEVGLNYLVGCLPEHSALFLVTSDEHIFLVDMLSPFSSEELKGEEIRGIGSDISVKDIVEFSRNPKPGFIMFDLLPGKLAEELSDILNERQNIQILEPDHGQQTQILENTAIAFYKLGMKDMAIETYRQMIAINPKNLYAHSNLGIIFEELGLKNKAAIEYKEAIKIDPEDPYTYYRLGIILSRLGRNEEAIEAYQKAISINPNEFYVYNELGTVLFNIGRHEESIEAYNHSIALDKTYPFPYLMRGEALSKLGRTQEAIDSFKQAIELLDKDKNKDSVRKAQEKIAELERSL